MSCIGKIRGSSTLIGQHTFFSHKKGVQAGISQKCASQNYIWSGTDCSWFGQCHRQPEVRTERGGSIFKHVSQIAGGRCGLLLTEEECNARSISHDIWGIN